MDSSVHPRIRQCAVLEADAVCDHLHVPSDGLSTEQAEKSRAQFGSNAVSSGTADTVGFRLRRAFINPFTVILFLSDRHLSGDRCRSGFQFQPQRHNGHHYMLHATAQRHGALCAGAARKAHLRPPL
ncbi:cation-transporting P-type ATPase [Butyricicoccus pullicaecorum]|uniref:cation-transporting P-type ATPase n=1 Tax=Butyricicoccus pullicaecorum TaxID=501571 RepID=UPI00351FCE50